MILLDLSQVMISNIMVQVGQHTDAIQPDLVRHMVINTIRSLKIKFGKEFGELVIACDDRKYWRREIFPHYKASRKKNRDASGHDWNSIFECLHKIKEELKEYSPYKVIDVDGAEADDVIASLVLKYSPHGKIMILSSDKDFAQLQKYPNVEQFSPILKRYIKEPLPSVQLKQMIIRGDKGDGVPNILTKDDVFVVGGRQKPITEAKIINWLNQDPTEFCNEEMLRNYSRNESLIDLTKIPQTIVSEILDKYESTQAKTKSVFMNYMIANKLKNLIEVLDEF